MKRVATIILNRNLPDVADALFAHLQRYDGDNTDVYVVEAGSDSDNLSKNTTWHASWPDAKAHGLRYCRGMNYGLSQLWKEEKFKQYDAFFLLSNDTELQPQKTIGPLVEILDQHPRVGILSPCSKRWGERFLLEKQSTKYFWFIHNNAYLLRREFIESIFNNNEPDAMNFLFDGANFRGYGSENELIAKAYANDWAAAITSSIWAGENESHLLEKSDLIKTEAFEDNLKLYAEEGRAWMRKKYGFNSHWSMQQYVKSFYDRFFEFHPECAIYKI
jgi:predicted heme/steroid binding protein